MNININKDFVKEYKDDFIRGLSLREVVFGATGLVIAGGVTVVIWLLTDISPQICVYIAVPLAAPVLAMGFYDYQGMTILQLLKEMYYSHKTSKLIWEAGEQEGNEPRTFHTGFRESVSADMKSERRRRGRSK